MKFHSIIFATLMLIIVDSMSWAEPPPDFLVRSDDVVRGDPQAPITLLEYSDFTCGFCEKFFHQTWPALLTQYVETGKVRFVYRDYPRTPSGAALDAANATRCAADQQAYWSMHDRLFNSGGRFSVGQLQGYANELDLDTTKFSECLNSQRHVAAIYKDRLQGGSLGIRGTPGFVLFLTDLPDDGDIVLIPGAFPIEVFKEQIDKMLESVQSNKSTPDTQQNTVPEVEGT